MLSTGKLLGTLEFPVMLRAAGRPAVMGIIELMTAHECRLRSLVSFDEGEQLEFELVGHAGVKAKVSGRIVSRTSRPPRFSYELRIDPTAGTQTDSLVGVIAELAQRQAAVRTLPQSSADSALTRSSVRVGVNFYVGYCVADGAFGHARATNLSAGGMLLLSTASIPVGSSVELTFKLPAVATFPESKELVLLSRIVAHQPASDEQTAYNVAFYQLAAEIREQIEKFVERCQ